MFSPIFSLMLFPFLITMFMAINMGGSGTSPSFAVAYGSNVIRKDLIPGLFGLFVFLGAVVAGKKVALTVGGDILPGHFFNLSMLSIIFLSVSLSLFAANLLKVPQSTSQSTVFALSGAAVYMNALQTKKLFLEIIPAWFIMPILSFAIMLSIGKFIYNPIVRRKNGAFDSLSEHPALKAVVLLSACYVSFCIGSNNVANASGPIASMISNELSVDVNGADFPLVLIVSTLLVSPCFAIGSSILGTRALQTTGREMVEIGLKGATAVSLVTATLLLLASVSRGIPVSLVQMNALAIMGLGISKKGWRHIFALNSIRKLAAVWIAAPVISMLLSFALTALADRLGLL